MKTSYRHFHHALGLATVHLVWIPCRRKRVFYRHEPLKLRWIELFQSVANDNQWSIKALEMASDHIHRLVEHSIAQVVKRSKGVHHGC